MNALQEKEIARLRENCVGYVTIAKKLGISRDEVRNYCRKTGLGGRKSFTDVEKQSEENVAKRIEESKNNVAYVGGYEKNTGKVVVRCKDCGHEWIVCYTQVVYKKCVCAECKKKEKARREIKTKEEKYCRRLEIKEAKEQKKSAENAKKIKRFVCKVCGKQFLSKGLRAYCSKECAKKAENRNKDHRIPKDKIIDKDITLAGLYKRDIGVCYLCGKKCNPDDYTVVNGTMIAGDWYPSIDHVIPISKGGNHAWNNIRLAHRVCNSFKSDKVTPATLALTD